MGMFKQKKKKKNKTDPTPQTKTNPSVDTMKYKLDKV